MDSKILGINTDTFYALLFLILLLILGIVSFHYYVYIGAGNSDIFNAKAGVGFTLLQAWVMENITQCISKWEMNHITDIIKVVDT